MTTLTIDSRKLTGAPDSGTVNIRTSRAPIFDTATNTTFSGSVTVPLEADGTLEVTLPASERAETGPAFLYTIEAKLASGTWLIRNVYLPDVQSIDLTALHNVAPAPGEPTRIVKVPTGGLDGQVLVWGDDGFTWMDVPPGPKGDPGEVTTAALTAALARKVTGTGMEVRVDTTVGTRVLLDHPGGTLMLAGDTGWRDVSGSLLNGWTGNRVRLRRRGNDVELNVVASGVPLTGAAATSKIFLPWFDGFRAGPAGDYGWLGMLGSSAGTTSVSREGSSGIGASPTAGTLTGSVAWTTDQPWPTMLPGLPG